MTTQMTTRHPARTGHETRSQPSRDSGHRLQPGLDHQPVGRRPEPGRSRAGKPGGGGVRRTRRVGNGHVRARRRGRRHRIGRRGDLGSPGRLPFWGTARPATGAGFGIAAAVVSWIQLALGAWQVYGPVAGRRTATAGIASRRLTLFDGEKMFLLAAMAVALSAVALSSPALPRWLAPLGFLLAASLAVSGLGYVLLAQGLASAAYVSGILLLAFVTSTGVTLGVAPADPGGTSGLTPSRRRQHRGRRGQRRLAVLTKADPPPGKTQGRSTWASPHGSGGPGRPAPQ